MAAAEDPSALFADRGSDVGSVLRQILTRTDGFFDGLNHLTLSHKLILCQVVECLTSDQASGIRMIFE